MITTTLLKITLIRLPVGKPEISSGMYCMKLKEEKWNKEGGKESKCKEKKNKEGKWKASKR